MGTDRTQHCDIASLKNIRKRRKIGMSSKDITTVSFYPTEFNFYNETSSSQFHFLMNSTRIALVILLRIGFVLIQVGSVPVNNVNVILLQNIVDVSSVTTTYLLIGSLIAYNGDVGGLIGAGYWIGDSKADKDEIIIGWAAVVIASAICTCGIAGRTHTIGYLVIGILLSAFVQPFLIHWVWTPKGWMKRNVLNGRDVTFRDYAGSGVVHLVGGLSALIGCMVLGRRILRLKEIDEASMAVSSSATVFAGQLLVLVGLQSLSMPISEEWKHKIEVRNSSQVLVNNLIGGSSCCLFVVALQFIFTKEEFNHWTVMRCVQATISGLVIVSAGADVYSPQAAIGLGCTGGAIFYLVSRIIFHSALEDYCNVVAIHLSSAILGSCLAPLCAFKDRHIMLVLFNFSWQLICIIVIIFFVATTMLLSFFALQCLRLLRNRTEYLNHLKARVAADRGPQRSYFQRLFFPDSSSVYLQPGSITNSSEEAADVSKF